MSRFWSENIHTLTPYTPGEQPQIENLIKLNTNENPYGPSPRVLAAINCATDQQLRKYPDPNAGELKSTIAEYYQLEVDQVCVGNSSDEVLACAFQGLLKQDLPLLFPDITYGFYPVWCRLFNIDYQTVPLADDFSINVGDYQDENGGIIFANPNSPTGTTVTITDIKRLLDKHAESVVVIDEAYVDFAEASATSLIEHYPNLLVTQTLSKSRSLAGLRVGLACGHTDLIEALERVKNSFNPYALDRLALAGATAAFKDDAYFKSTCAKVIATRTTASAQLSKLGFTVLPSQANFLFARHRDAAAIDLFKALRSKGIIVRHFAKARIDDYLRISVGTDAEMAALTTTLDNILNAN